MASKFPRLQSNQASKGGVGKADLIYPEPSNNHKDLEDLLFKGPVESLPQRIRAVLPESVCHSSFHSG